MQWGGAWLVWDQLGVWHMACVDQLGAWLVWISRSVWFVWDQLGCVACVDQMRMHS